MRILIKIALLGLLILLNSQVSRSASVLFSAMSEDNNSSRTIDIPHNQIPLNGIRSFNVNAFQLIDKYSVIDYKPLLFDLNNRSKRRIHFLKQDSFGIRTIHLIVLFVHSP